MIKEVMKKKLEDYRTGIIERRRTLRNDDLVYWLALENLERQDKIVRLLETLVGKNERQRMGRIENILSRLEGFFYKLKEDEEERAKPRRMRPVNTLTAVREEE